jgi:small-conductance mechanosensitive channel
MEQLIDLAAVRKHALELLALAQAYLTSIDFLWQVGAIVVSGLIAALVGPRLKRLAERHLPGKHLPAFRRTLVHIIRDVGTSGLWFVLVWAAFAVATSEGLAGNVVRIAVNLLGAWVVIRAGTRIVRNPVLSNALFIVAWGVAALNILGLLGPILTHLNAIGFSLGQRSITGLTVLKGALALILLMWAALAMSRFLADRIRTLEQITPTLQILLSKIVQLLLFTLAVVFALQIVGIPLTTFAIFGGALGVGVGLGLQKAASNIIGGVMLLVDKSIKPGDVVSVGDTFGWVTSMGGRYVAVRTRDGIEHLIPNEVFIAQGVENWSHTERAVRIRLPFGISYGANPHQAIGLALEAAAEIERVLKAPQPVCLFKAFGDSSLDLELRVWINDPQNGVSNIKSDVYLKIWDKLKAANVEIPFPQRDLHVKEPVEVRIANAPPAAL